MSGKRDKVQKGRYEMNELELINRTSSLFEKDLSSFKQQLDECVSGSSVLVVGGAGTIGQATVIELFKRSPKRLHVIDISENNLVELVRNLRSSLGYLCEDFQTFALDVASLEFDSLMKTVKPYDYIFNLSALKHVRSEKDPFTLMRMVQTNVTNSVKLARLANYMNSKKYFCVSTDKAANPVNMMGASKRIMEMFLHREAATVTVSMARFANVAFSDGSLLHGFNQRYFKKQPLTAPHDISRYFIAREEAGELCLLSGILGKSGEIFFPKPDSSLQLTSFTSIAQKYLERLNYKVQICDSEDQARDNSASMIDNGYWPCYFFKSDTSGEKSFEEFYTENEKTTLDLYDGIGVVSPDQIYNDNLLDAFSKKISDLKQDGVYNKEMLVLAFKELLPEFNHLETGKSLDEKM